ncbi:MAG: hypothetical protein KDF60_14810 [Calditrichaeota bacterium]|nr:hypothetical protein [Calditrichota bacterium]
MKSIISILIVLVLNILLVNCAANLNGKKGNEIIDTVYVRDTTIIAEKSVFLNATKMNVLYIGVENPVKLELSGINPDEVSVSISSPGATVRKQDDTHYLVSVTTPGEAVIDVKGDGVSKRFLYRVKRIPDPVALFSNSKGGYIGVGEIKAQIGLIAFFDAFDFEAKCDIRNFDVTRIAQRFEPVSVSNIGAAFNGNSKSLISKAKPGDTYIFSNIRVYCPSDDTYRMVNSMVFQVK